MPHLLPAFAPAALDSIRHVYLTGPVVGPEALDAFLSAAVALRMLGLSVTGPFEGAEAPALLDADAVVALPGWETSPSAEIDVTLAESLGRPVVPLCRMLAVQNSNEPEALGLAPAS